MKLLLPIFLICGIFFSFSAVLFFQNSFAATNLKENKKEEFLLVWVPPHWTNDDNYIPGHWFKLSGKPFYRGEYLWIPAHATQWGWVYAHWVPK